MKQSSDETTKELPSAVDDAASVILESKRKEHFVTKTAPKEKKFSVRGLIIFVSSILVPLAFSAILLYLL
ncbi:MAG: hypothetical protein CMQ39_08580 [Gammaproteobacteria bacterium]|nr:hypothetical protein [Gammaproteobacteria bacterium]|tara:strand:+ start:1127 stop:1336 length:210 start_codon:yes stop_codon:yes gene_type:complete